MTMVTRQDSGETFERGNLPSRATVRYLVQGAAAYRANDACLAVQSGANFEDPNDAVPLGAAHPDAIAGDRLKASRYRAVQRAGAGNDRSWFVDVEFSLEGGGANFEEPPISEPTYATIEFSTVDRQIKAPFWIKVPQAGVSPSGTLSTTFKWQEEFTEFSVAGLQLRVVTNVSATQYALSNWVTNQDQVDKIHTIGGRKWQYIGASSSQIAIDVWRVTHEWWADPGNGPVTANLPAGVNGSDVVFFDGDRPEFQDYQSYRVPVGAGIPGVGPVWVPVVGLQEPYIEEPSGFQNLVGHPFNGAID
jgi:hypothetical protein